MKRGALTVFMLLISAAGSPLAFGFNIPKASSPALDCEGSVRALSYQGYKCRCSGGQLDCGGGTVPKGRPKSASETAQVKSMLVGGIIEGLFSNMMSQPSQHSAAAQRALLEQQQAAAQAARQKELWRQARDAEFQAERDRMLGAYKGLEGTSASGYKAGEGSALDFKSLDGDSELLAASARQPFDTAGSLAIPSPGSSGTATPFFGDTMPDQDLRLLVQPENDPRIVDLRQAKTFISDNLKKEAQPVATKKSRVKGEGEPIIEPPDCAALTTKLNGFLQQRSRFNSTILLAQSQVNEWETANRAALMNAAKDGIEYFAGGLLETLANRGKAAQRLQEIYTRNAASMAAEVVDILALEAKINRLQLLASAGKMAQVTSQVNDWQTFTKDGMSALLTQLHSSNAEVKEILADPKVGKYFQSESAELNLLLDISKMMAANKIFGKWVAKQIPVIGLTEISIKQLYNGTDWANSLYRLMQANDINGRVMESAKSLQKHIDDTRIALGECPGR